MAWFSRNVSLGNFPDFSDAVNKLSESVKSIEKNFDNALGIEETSDASGSGSEASGLWGSATDRKTIFDPIIGFMGQRGGEGTAESLENSNSAEPTSPVKETQTENDKLSNQESEQTPDVEKANVEAEAGEEIKAMVESLGKPHSEPTSPVREKQSENDNVAIQESEQIPNVDQPNEELKDKTEIGGESNEELKDTTVETETGEEMKATSGESIVCGAGDKFEAELDLPSVTVEVTEQKNEEDEQTESTNNLKEDDRSEKIAPIFSGSVQPESPTNFQENMSEEMHSTQLVSVQPESTSHVGQIEVATPVPAEGDATSGEKNSEFEDNKEVFQAQALDVSPEDPAESKKSPSPESTEKMEDVGVAEDNPPDNLPVLHYNDMETSIEALDLVIPPNATLSKSIEMTQHSKKDTDTKKCLSTGANMPDIAESLAELEKVKKEMKMMETALQGAARQAQAKADEIARLMNENEQLKSVVDDLRKNSNEAKIESLREEHHQRVAAIERKVYALTRERDTLRKEQNRKSDAAALLKEKDEIITQVMAEGEKLSKKQATQESQIRKLRAQIRELEEEKKGLLTKLQAEENKSESLKKDKAATEKLLQETVEKHQAELATQKEYYSNALNEAKEAEALAEARANTEARTEMESQLREAKDRESILVQTLEELRQTLSRKEQQAVFKEDMFHRDIEDLQRRYQASERRCEELITQVPDSTRPLLRQIEAMQETSARRAEAWTEVERSLNSRLQEAEARAAASEEKERSINERLTQTLSRINVLEAQISCLRAEQTQLTRSLEKERQRAGEHRQEYLALKEEADTHESRVSQLEEEIREHRKKHKDELHQALAHQELLQKELEREKSIRLDLERASSLHSPRVPDHSPIIRQKSSSFENGSSARKISSASSLSSMEESHFLQATLGAFDNASERKSAAGSPMSPYYTRSMTSNTYEAALRQKEGELASYTSRLASLESIRDSLAEELVKMTAECEKLRAGASTLPGIRAELEALRRRHSAALELMGERDEELEELRADIVDLKEMYREQVNVLVNKVQILSSSVGAS